MNNKQLAAKVVGTLLAIIAGIVALSVAFSFTVLPIIKYHNAEKQASMGNYASASRILRGMSYKDSEMKYGEYSLIAGEEFFEAGDYDNASIYLTGALNSENEEAAQKAAQYFKED